jgi:hypothetical protein
VAGDTPGVGAPLGLESTRGAGGTPFVSLGPTGAFAAAWPATSPFGRPVVGLADHRADSRTLTGTVAAPAGGPLGEIAGAGTGLGDGVVAFRQGTGPDTTIAAALVQAPPQPFEVNAPTEWVPPDRASVTWDPAQSGVGGVRYTAALDGEVEASGLPGPPFLPRARGLDNGRYAVTIVATDSSGLQTVGGAAELKVDGRPPTARATGKGPRVTVKVTDGDKAEQSGVSPDFTRVAWGDGKVSRHRATFRHRYSRPGTHRISVDTRDLAGNRTLIPLKAKT